MILANKVIFGRKYNDDRLLLYNDLSNLSSYSGGSGLYDLSPLRNNSTLVNATFSVLNGGSLLFNGTGSRVTLSSVIQTGNSFTLNAWIYPSSFATRNSIIANSYNFVNNVGWVFSLGGNGGDRSFFIAIGRDNAYRISSNYELDLNQWSFVSAVVRNGGEFIELYKNGIMLTNTTAILAPISITYSYNQANIGYRDYNLTTDPFNGKIGFVSVYGTSLTASKIFDIYNRTNTRFI